MRKKTRGLSLAEIVVGVSILLLVATGALVALRSFMKTNISRFNYDRVNEALNYWHGVIRYESGFTFDAMEHNWVDETHASTDYSKGQPGGIGKNGTDPAFVTVFSTISALIGGAPIRTVSLRAEWAENGVKKTRNLDFTIAYTRAKMAGGHVVMQFLDNDSPQNPIMNVHATTIGQENAQEECTSNSLGVCDLYGVLLTNSGVDITIDGQQAVRDISLVGAGYYFETGNPSAAGNIVSVVSSTGPAYVRVIHTGPIKAGPQQIDLGSMQLDAPGQILVTVKDVSNGAVLKDIRVELTVHDKSRLKIPLDLAASQAVGTTDVNGQYRFTSLIPSMDSSAAKKSHALYIIGNSVYAGLAFPDDTGVSIPYQTVRSRPAGNPSNQIVYVIKRGSIHGGLGGVQYNSMADDFVASGHTPGFDINFRLLRQNGKSYHAAVTIPAKHSIPLDKTKAWDYWGASAPLPVPPEGEDKGFTNVTYDHTTGQYNGDYFTPKVVFKDALDSYPIDEQYNFAQPILPWKKAVNVDYTVASPFLPVFVLQTGDRLTQAKFGIQNLIDSQAGSLRIFPSGQENMEGFQKKIRTNHNELLDLLLLERSTVDNTVNSPLGNVKGSIIDSWAGAPLFPNNRFNVGGLTYHEVSINWIYNGGYITFAANGDASLTPSKLTQTTAMNSSSDHTYNYKQTVAGVDYYSLIPNVGNNTTFVNFRGIKNKIVENKDYLIDVIAWKRLRDASGNIYMSTVTSSFSMNNVQAWAAGYTQGPALWTDTINVVPAGPKMQASFTGAAHPSYSQDTWLGFSAPSFSLAPGGSGTTANIFVNSQGFTHLFTRMFFKLDFPDWSPAGGYYADYDGTKYTGTWKTIQRGRTGKIYGKVLDPDGHPLVGVKVELWAPGFGTFTSMNTLADATAPANAHCAKNAPDADPTDTIGDQAIVAGSGYQYVFDNISFIPQTEVNLQLRINKTSAAALLPIAYEGVDFVQNNSFECIKWNRDFSLSPINQNAVPGNP